MTELKAGPVKGWKCFNHDMTCRGFKFEPGKRYEHTGAVRLCNSGFHFHENGEDLYKYYAESGSRVCEVTAYNVHTSNDKSVCGIIEVGRELSFLERLSIRYAGYGGGYGDGYGYGGYGGYGYGGGAGGDGCGDGYGYGNGGYGYGGYGNGGYGDGDGYGYGNGNLWFIFGITFLEQERA